MHLRDASDHASVDLFLRTLSFPFPGRDLVGIPGDLAGLSEAHPEVEAAVLLHELEHLSSLIFPLGTVFPALALRAHDLYNAAARHFASYREAAFGAETPSAGPDELDLMALQAGLAASQHAEFVTLALTTAELLLPLLEGLALIAEMEQTEGVWIWQMALTLEYLHLEHRTALANREARERLDDPQVRAAVFRDLGAVLDRQLAHSRRRELDGDLVDLVFRRRAGDTRAEARAPYFYGYLFIRRLYQEWAARVPGLDSGAFLHAVSRLVYAVLPLTLLPIYSVKDHAGDAASGYLVPLFADLLRAALALPEADIRRLLETSDAAALLRMTSGGRLESLARDEPNPDVDVTVYVEVLAHVFDARDPSDSRLAENWELLDEIGTAMFLVPVAERTVVVVGIDPGERTAILVEPGRAQSGEEAGRWLVRPAGVTYFRFDGDDIYRRFLEIWRRKGAVPPEVRLGEGPYRLGAPGEGAVGKLVTYCWFWPEGVPRVRDGRVPVNRAVEIVRNPRNRGRRGAVRDGLVLGRPGPRRATTGATDAGPPEPEAQPEHSELLAPDFRLPRYILAELEVISPSDGGAGAIAASMRDQYTPERLGKLRRDARDVYARLLFPSALDELRHALGTAKLEALAPLLGDDMRLLRRWLLGGLVLTPEQTYAPATAEEAAEARAAVERIRAAARASTGVPLVGWRANPQGVVLDLSAS